jgi:hypothetical protein
LILINCPCGSNLNNQNNKRKCKTHIKEIEPQPFWSLHFGMGVCLHPQAMPPISLQSLVWVPPTCEIILENMCGPKSCGWIIIETNISHFTRLKIIRLCKACLSMEAHMTILEQQYSTSIKWFRLSTTILINNVWYASIVLF